MTGDGLQDVVLSRPGTGDLRVLPGNGDRSFGQVLVFDTLGRTSQLASGDVDGDGMAELFVLTSGPPRIGMHETGVGGLGPVQEIVSTGLPTSILVADVGRDRIDDLCYSRGGLGGRVFLARGSSAGLLAGEQLGEFADPVLFTDVADLDGDKQAELVLLMPSAGRLVLFQALATGDYEAREIRARPAGPRGRTFSMPWCWQRARRPSASSG